MPINFGWESEQKTIICYTYEGRWTWDEYYAALKQSQALWDEVNYRVDVIVDLRASAGFPAGNMLGHFRNTTKYYNNSKAGNTAIVGANDFFRLAADLFNRIYNRVRYNPKGNFFLVKDMEAARAILDQYR